MHKLKIALLIAQLGFGALDSHSTRHVITHGGFEYNPFVKPFAHSPGLYASNAAQSLGKYFIARKIQHKHPKLAWALQIEDAAGHASGWLVTRRAP